MTVFAPLANYFDVLASKIYSYLNQLPVSLKPEALDSIMSRLKPALDHITPRALAEFGILQRPTPTYDPNLGLGVGLNTIGMLADRFTILLIREWNIRHKGECDESKAANLRQHQTLDIIHAMATARPGSSSLNTKITRIVSDSAAQTWAEAIWGLFSTNLLLWESQEILYIRDIAALPAEELRSYIKWFAEGNIRRNGYIQLCETSYWRA